LLERGEGGFVAKAEALEKLEIASPLASAFVQWACCVFQGFCF
jgi:hypothetical protein